MQVFSAVAIAVLLLLISQLFIFDAESTVIFTSEVSNYYLRSEVIITYAESMSGLRLVAE
jgi:hypothetical protein